MRFFVFIEQLPTPEMSVGNYLFLSGLAVFIGLLSLRGNPIKGG
jgi:hypothetical protein